MFGIVPKKLWQRLNPADDQNMCTSSMKSLLIEVDDRKILIDTGIGDKQDEKFRSHFHPHGDQTLKTSLEKAGVKLEDITDVFLTHLHFDHCGGAIKRVGEKLVPVFPNATYFSTQEHWDHSLNSNFKEAASFLKENILPIEQSGRLVQLDSGDGSFWVKWMHGISIRKVYGHTKAMMILKIPIKSSLGNELIYCADLMPSSGHIGMPYVMSYDIQPLKTLEEKKWLLADALNEKQILFFEHDPKFDCGTIKKNEKGRIVWDGLFQLSDVLK